MFRLDGKGHANTYQAQQALAACNPSFADLMQLCVNVMTKLYVSPKIEFCLSTFSLVDQHVWHNLGQLLCNNSQGSFCPQQGGSLPVAVAVYVSL